jgi:hypothetical protein
VDTPSGLQYDEIAEGAGAEAKSGQKVSVHYTGTLVDGKRFDRSRDRGKPFQFTLQGPQGPGAGSQLGGGATPQFGSGRPSLATVRPSQSGTASTTRRETAGATPLQVSRTDSFALTGNSVRPYERRRC